MHERLTKGKALSSGVSVELYGGCCGISRAIARHGGVAESYEILRSAKEDLTLPSQRRALFSRVRQGLVRSPVDRDHLRVLVPCATGPSVVTDATCTT